MPASARGRAPLFTSIAVKIPPTPVTKSNSRLPSRQ
jgi:hypothetical protein